MFTLKPARAQRRSRRGPGVSEYHVPVEPPPTAQVRDLYNATRATGWPRLTPTGFLLLCHPNTVEARTGAIASEILPHLEELSAQALLP